MDIVFATTTCIAGDVRIVQGSHWPADDPIVRAYPMHFTDDPRYGLVSSRPLGVDGYPVIESATAAPGEKRSIGRGRKSGADEK